MQSLPFSRLSEENIIETIGQEWFLATAGTPDKFNMLTASWGGIGYLWNRPVAFLFIRPERYTHCFIEANERVTLAFLGHDKAMRQAYALCGSKSGRDMNKAEAAGLTPIATPQGNTTFAEARLTIEGRKLFRADMETAHFLDKAVLERWYNDQPGGSFHSIYVIEIEAVYGAE